MESVNQVKEALSARSRTATLDELRSEGRRKVRLIRAEHVAAMISEAVHAAIEMSGLIPKEEAERLVESSRQEFRSILKEREAEVRQAQANEEQLQLLAEELNEARSTIAALERQLEEQKPAAQAPAAAVAAMAGQQPSPEMLYMLMNELATLKASMGQAAQPVAAPAAAGADFSAAIDKLAGTLNARLEQFGKKMGISAAVEGAEVNFDGLFKDSGKELESNMENIQIKQKAGGGIAANLAKLKKLKGGS